ncbi:MAG: phosphopantothenoylcysteine decarboxylase [Patescibacteria group bacterium]
MRILITAGATQVPIDQVRAISNIFKGKTGTEIAYYLYWKSNHRITLVTSNPELAEEYCDEYVELTQNIGSLFDRPIPLIIPYKTFDELARIMEKEIRTGDYDVVIHSAAVSDYRVAGVYLSDDGKMEEVDCTKKISSKHAEIFLKLVPTYKIIDKIRREWGFKGTLVKFKLQVGVSDEELIEIAKRSCVDSDADFIVANCLEWAKKRAYIIDRKGKVEKISRKKLSEALLKRLS